MHRFTRPLLATGAALSLSACSAIGIGGGESVSESSDMSIIPDRCQPYEGSYVEGVIYLAGLDMTPDQYYDHAARRLTDRLGRTIQPRTATINLVGCEMPDNTSFTVDPDLISVKTPEAVDLPFVNAVGTLSTGERIDTDCVITGLAGVISTDRNLILTDFTPQVTDGKQIFEVLCELKDPTV